VEFVAGQDAGADRIASRLPRLAALSASQLHGGSMNGTIAPHPAEHLEVRLTPLAG
jgi:hypothetical protein